jgi:hypothetical protein
MTENTLLGRVYRDTYGDKHRVGGNKRTIKIVEVYPNGVRAEILTDVLGIPPERPRFTRLMMQTLRAGYEVAP